MCRSARSRLAPIFDSVFDSVLAQLHAPVLAIIAGLSLSSISTYAQVTIPTLLVGDPGNASDTTSFGRVDYLYNIATYEVTAGQYAAFLNAVARTDFNGLYNPSQASSNPLGSGLIRSGFSGNFTYSVHPNFANRPVTFVSFWDATRFANWMHNGQPIGLQNNSTTEDGAYTLTISGIANNTVTRNPDWQWALTSEDEWYKAAYYKGGNTNAGYWAYPTRSNQLPGRDLNDPTGNNANYFDSLFPGPIQSPFFATLGGEFQNSASPYGTFDQGGNVWEWNEAIIIFFGSSFRGQLGGSFDFIHTALRADTRSFISPSEESQSYGFRVVQAQSQPCIADFNQDGGVTGDDVAAFFTDFQQGKPAADVNQDGGITGDDVAFFFTRFEQGC